MQIKEQDTNVDKSANNGEQEVVQSFINVHFKWLLVISEMWHFRCGCDFKDLSEDKETNLRYGETDPTPFYGAGTFLQKENQTLNKTPVSNYDFKLCLLCSVFITRYKFRPNN